jgi:hypothetical protein
MRKYPLSAKIPEDALPPDDKLKNQPKNSTSHAHYAVLREQ